MRKLNFSDEELATKVNEIIDWINEHESGDHLEVVRKGRMPMSIDWDEEEAQHHRVRPILDGGEGQKHVGARVDAKILRMAAAKAREEIVITGGNTSKLVELLLWEYIGEPEELIVR